MLGYADEALLVQRKFPIGTTRHSVDGVSGWGYTFRCKLGNSYTMFIYWNAGLGHYRVILIDPEAEVDRGNAHDKHLFSNGCLCLGDKHRTNFLHVFGQSVLWATAYSVYRRDGVFKFSTNQ